MPSLFGDSFRNIGPAPLAGSGAPAYFKVQGLPGVPVIISRFSYAGQEKVQVVEAFNEYIHVYAFGRSASQVQIGGHSLNIGDDFASARALKEAYSNVLRAFKVAQSGKLVSIAGPIGVLKGIANSLQFDMAAGQDSVLNFQMNFIVLDGSSESSSGGAGGEGGGGGGNGAQPSEGGAANSAGQNVNMSGGSNLSTGQFPGE